MLKIQDIILKIKYVIKSKAFEKKPLTIIFRVILLILLSLIRLNIKYKVLCKQSSFIYTLNQQNQIGLGGRGQFILREFYDPFFSCGDKLFLKKFNFIDIGCSRGFFSMYLLKLRGLKSKGLCIEPLKNAIYDFKKILNLNNINNVKIINGVISNQSNKKIPLYQVNEKHGYFSIFKDVRFADNKSPKKINVKSYTIDELIIKYKKLKNVELIKIDAEGAELEILLKGTKTINKFRPIIYCEVTRKKNKILNFLKNKNYKLFVISNGKIRKLNHKNFEGDLLAINKKSNLINQF